MTDSPVRPQTLVLAFLGDRLLGRDLRVATGSLLDVLARVGVTEHAARSALTRMTAQGLLDRERRGKQVYLGLTPRSREILDDGERRIWRDGVVNDEPDAAWTLLGFTIPESHRAQRHLLRSRLLWAGFGLLQGGLWISPADVDVPALLDGIDSAGQIRAFRARTLDPTDVADLVAGAWDLDALAGGYRRFTERWSAAPGPRDDALARQLLLTAGWLTLIRQDPRLPARYLPADWPAAGAQELFRRLHAELDPRAERLAREVLDVAGPAS
ncbi:PaaX family transcriptional regulator [Myceligenerans crystallogenes]|uniref:PaaX family transcriptional regulator C-terminal domain-containing protein n=1 Tax=Myceligenerans crystallogenes TaxID=316335 RepID=A0ABN2N6W6_9MICO